MALYINTNIASIAAQNNLSSSQTKLADAIQQLSSGLSISSAADNPASYAIATRMGGQISGMTQAIKNANDGVSLAQTAGGALTSITNDLQSMRSLAVQAANASNSSTDRATLQAEIVQLQADINSVSSQTNFNGVNLLDGSFNAQTFQVGPNAGETIQVTAVGNMSSATIGSVGTTYGANVSSGSTVKALLAGDLTLNGFQVGASAAGLSPGEGAGSASSIAAAINNVSPDTGVTAIANATTYTSAAATAFTSIAANTFSINGVNVGKIAAGGNAQGQGANVAAAINAISTATGVTASADATSGIVTLTAADGRNINIALNPTTTTPAFTSITPTNFTAQTGLAANVSDSVTAAGAVAAAGTNVEKMKVNGVTVTYTGTSTTATAAQNAQGLIRAFETAAAASTNSTTLAGLTLSLDSTNHLVLTSDGTQANFKITSTLTGTKTATVTTTGTLGFKTGTKTSTAAIQTGVTYASQHGSVSLTSSSSNGIIISGGAVASAGLTTGTTSATNVSSVKSVAGIDISTAAGASAALAVIDGALTTVNTAAAEMGAFQNRFTAAITNLQSNVQNLTAAQSRIRDTDYASVTSQLTKEQILQQAGTAMLAQANTMPNTVLTLLK